MNIRTQETKIQHVFNQKGGNIIKKLAARDVWFSACGFIGSIKQPQSLDEYILNFSYSSCCRWADAKDMFATCIEKNHPHKLKEQAFCGYQQAAKCPSFNSPFGKHDAQLFKGKQF